MERTKIVKFAESTAAQCRWSEYAAELFGDWDVIWDESNADYQGAVRFLAHKDGRFGFLSYSYGSCAGCDSWEGQDDGEIRKDFQNMAEFFDDVHVLKKFAEQVSYGAPFERAVDEYWFHANLEKKLEE